MKKNYIKVIMMSGVLFLLCMLFCLDIIYAKSGGEGEAEDKIIHVLAAVEKPE